METWTDGKADGTFASLPGAPTSNRFGMTWLSNGTLLTRRVGQGALRPGRAVLVAGPTTR